MPPSSCETLRAWLLSALVVHGVVAGNPDAKRLYDDLLSNYNKLVRPVVNTSDVLRVCIKLKLSQLIDVNLKNQIMTTNLWVEQSWYDYKLRWEPKEYGGVHMLHVPSDHIWRPDIVLYNNADGNFEVTLATKATIYHQGLVEWKPPAIYKSSCEIDVEYFPFDEQTCVLKFGSWTYDGFKVDLRHMDEKAGSNVVDVGVDLSEFYMSVEWDILEVPAVRNEKFYTCCDEPYLDITFNITMRRKTLFYTVNIIIPCMGISFLTVLTFYLPSDSGEKVTLSISILISLHVFFLLVVEIIPPTSLVVPLLGKYLIFAMILVSISICVTVVVLNVHFRSPQTHKMSPWVKRVFIHILPRLLVMKRPTYVFETNSKFLANRFITRGREPSTCLYPYHTTVHREDSSPKRRFPSRTPSKEDLSPSLADGGPFGGSCQIHGPVAMAHSDSEELAGPGDNDNGLKSPVLRNPAYSHSRCPPEIHKSCFCVRFIAEHTKMLEDSTKFFRHGARTPESKDEYPNDPYKYETFLPMGWGQLTNYGKRQAYALGKNLRRRYGSFLGDIYTPELVHAQSTDYDRTKMSAILALAGMFPPAPSQQWDDTLNWLPIPISYERDHLDFTLRRPNHYCPAYLRELDRVLQSEQAKEYLKKNKNVLDYVEENSGRPMNKLMDVFSIYQTLTAERGMNLTLPEWSKSVYPHGITEIAAKQCELENSNKILKRLNGGRSLKMVVNNMLAKATHNLRPRERKIFLFSGHENNVINVLAAMDLYKAHFPSYSSAVIIELHYLSDEDEYAVKVFYVKNVNEEAEEKQLKGCEVLCPLTKFLEIVEPHLPLNYTAECESDIFLS